MEEEEMNIYEQVACIGLYSRKWPSTTVLATTAVELFENESAVGPGEVGENYAAMASGVLSVGSRVVGPLLVEGSYAMELAEWVRYHWSFAKHQGLVCVLVPELTENLADDLVVYGAESTSSMEFMTQPGNYTIYRAVTPNEPPLSEKLSDFCTFHGLAAHLRGAIGLLKSSFPSVERLNLQLERDPETGDEWILIEFDVSGDVDEVLQKYDHYTDLLVKSVPWPERDRIRIAYNII